MKSTLAVSLVSLIALSALSACGPKSRYATNLAPTANPTGPAAPSPTPELKAPVDASIEISIEAVTANPFAPTDNPGSSSNFFPLGFGASQLNWGGRPDFTRTACATGELITQREGYRYQASSSFLPSNTHDLYLQLNPLRALRPEKSADAADGVNQAELKNYQPQYLEAAKSWSTVRNQTIFFNEVNELVRVEMPNSTVVKECENFGDGLNKKILSKVHLGYAVSAIFELKADNISTPSAKTILTAIFVGETNDYKDADLDRDLKALKNAKVVIKILQLGGATATTKENLTALNCNLTDWKNCRAFGKTITQSLISQTEPTSVKDWQKSVAVLGIE